MRIVEFTPTASSQFNEWLVQDKKIRNKIVELLKDIIRDPFKGLGKPEPLKHHFKGCWSRRINQEHRLVYKVTSDAIIVIACKFHY